MTSHPVTASGFHVIFDLDGTLVDSEPNYYEAGRRLLARHGVRDFDWETHTRFIGIGTRETLTVLRAEYGIDAPVDELLAGKNALYLELAGASTEVFPQMRVLVERLHAAGVPMAVASGSSRAAIEAVLAVTGLDAYIPLYVSAEEVAHGKPEPDVLPTCCSRTGSPRSRPRPRTAGCPAEAGPGGHSRRRGRRGEVPGRQPGPGKRPSGHPGPAGPIS
ncbi:HAD family hydrolase [Streptomyces sp. NPDC054995]